MPDRHKILMLDDEQDLLEMYREILGQLSSQPEVFTANTGPRAIALLESEPITLLISDLNMPKMDGLQVLSIVRRKYPQLRIVVLTAVVDEQYRSRAYAMGVDLFWEKPGNAQEIKLFQECIESLLGRDALGGFRGVQSKSLVDIIQLECLTQSSSVLRITRAGQEGRVWVQDGNVIDAETGTFRGEDAFREILAWKGGHFEILPPEPARERTIHNSYQGLLLDSAQAQDESQAQATGAEPGAGAPGVSSPLAQYGKIDGVEFILAVSAESRNNVESWGLENPQPLGDWARKTRERFARIGEKLQAGDLLQIEGYGLQRHVAISPRGNIDLCVAFRRTLTPEQVGERMKHVEAKWGS